MEASITAHIETTLHIAQSLIKLWRKMISINHAERCVHALQHQTGPRICGVWCEIFVLSAWFNAVCLPAWPQCVMEMQKKERKSIEAHKNALIKVLLTFCHYMVTQRLPPHNAKWSVGSRVCAILDALQTETHHRTFKHEANERETEKKKCEFIKLTLLTCANA